MNGSKRMKLFGLAILLVLVLMGMACKEQEAPELPPVVRPVKTLVVGGMADAELSFPGTVQASERSILSFRVPGRLMELPVDEGMTVKRGQLVARLDPTDFEIAVAEARAAFQKAEADYKRYKSLYEREAIPLAELELRRAEREVAKARFDQAMADLSYTYLKAPYTGYIGRKFVENFEDVLAKEEVVTLQNVANVEVVVDVPEIVMATISDRYEVGFFSTFGATPGVEYPMQFKEATAEADPQTLTYQITFTMPQPTNLNVLPGMTATVIARGTKKEKIELSVAVPALAVFAGQAGESLVWVVDPATNTVASREVEVGQVTGRREVWIESGLALGEVIVITAVQELVEGDEVRTIDLKNL